MNAVISTALGLVIFGLVFYVPYLLGIVFDREAKDFGSRWFSGLLMAIIGVMFLGLCFFVGDTILHAA